MNSALTLLALVAAGGLLPGCDGCGSSTSDATSPSAAPLTAVTSVWNAIPPQASAWAVVDLEKLRADGRFDALLEAGLPASAPDGAGQLGSALSRADRVLVAAADAFFSDRFHVLEGTWDGDALRDELQSGDGVASETMTGQAIGSGTLWSSAALPWAVAWDGSSLLATGPPTTLQMALPPRAERAMPEWANEMVVAASWTPPPLVTEVLADRVDRPELAEPIRALRRARLTVSAGAGLDVHVQLRFASAEQVEPGRAALEALVAVAALEFVDAPLTESLRGLTFETRPEDSTLDVWWQIDRTSVHTWLGFLETLAADGGPYDAENLAQEP